MSFLAKISAGLAKDAWLPTAWSSLCTNIFLSFAVGNVGMRGNEAGMQRNRVIIFGSC